MGKYVVKWNRSAYLQMISISVWYRENVALKAASSFISGVYKAIEQISSYPTIGMLDRKRSNARFKYHRCVATSEISSYLSRVKNDNPYCCHTMQFDE